MVHCINRLKEKNRMTISVNVRKAFTIIKNFWLKTDREELRQLDKEYLWNLEWPSYQMVKWSLLKIKSKTGTFRLKIPIQYCTGWEKVHSYKSYKRSQNSHCFQTIRFSKHKIPKKPETWPHIALQLVKNGLIYQLSW